MNWYKTAVIGEQALVHLKGFPQDQVGVTIEYLHSMPDNIQNYLWKQIKKIIKNKGSISVDEIKAIPVSQEQEIKIAPKMEQYVQNITNNKHERNWLRNLVSIGKVKEEDVYKIINLFNKFHNLPDNDKKITDFKDDSELSRYIDSKTPENILDPRKIPEGAKLLESQSSKDGSMQLYNITDQEAMDAIGGEANWCTLTVNAPKGGEPYEFEPFDYYCFVIDGQPEVLIHQGSDQIKDAHDDPVSDVHLIKAIEPYINKYKLNTHEGDFRNYDRTLSELKKFEEQVDNEKFVNRSIQEDVKTFALIPEKYWAKYTPQLVQRFKDPYDDPITEEDTGGGYRVWNPNLDVLNFNPFADFSYSILEQIGKYITLNNDTQLKKIMDGWLKNWMEDQAEMDGLSVGRYKKKVPPALGNNELFNEQYQKMIQEKKEYYLKHPDYVKDSPFKELREDPDIHQKLVEIWKERISEGKFLTNLDNAPDEAKYDPEIWKNLLVKRPEFWSKCPIEEVKNDPEIYKKAKEHFVNKAENARSAHDAHLKWVPEEFMKDVLNPDIWKRKILNNPFEAWGNCPVEEVKNDPEIINYVKDAWREKLTKVKRTYIMRVREWGQCPFDDIKNDPEVLKSVKWHAGAALIEDPTQFYRIPFKDVISNQDIWDSAFSENPNYLQSSSIPEKYKSKKAWKEAIIEVSPWIYLSCDNKDVLNDPEVVKAYIDYVKKIGLDKAQHLSPFKLEDNPELLKQYSAFIKEFLLKNPLRYDSYRHHPALNFILDDPEIQKAVIDFYKKNTNYLFEWNKEFGLPDWVKNDPELKKYLEDTLNELMEESTKELKEAALNENDGMLEVIINNLLRKAYLVARGDQGIYQKFLSLLDLPEIRKRFLESPKLLKNHRMPKGWIESHPEMQEAIKQYESKQLEDKKQEIIKNPKDAVHIYFDPYTPNFNNRPELQDPRVQEAIKQYLLSVPYQIYRLWVDNSLPDEMWKDPRIKEAFAIINEKETQKTREELSTAKTKDRLWSSAFNDNFIGKLS